MGKRVAVLIVGVIVFLGGAGLAVGGGALMVAFGSDNTFVDRPGASSHAPRRRSSRRSMTSRTPRVSRAWWARPTIRLQRDRRDA